MDDAEATDIAITNTAPTYATERKFNDLIAAAAFSLVCIALLLLSVASILFGNPQLLGNDNNKGDWLGEGLLQSMQQSQIMFILLPLQTSVIGMIWLAFFGIQPKLGAPLSLVSGFLLMFAGTSFLFFHASKHEYLLLHFIGLVLFAGCGWYGYVAWTRRNDIDITAAFIEEGLQAFRGGTIFFVGIFILAVQLTFWLFWTISAICLYSFPDGLNADKIDYSIRWVSIVLIFGGYWVWNFLQSIMAVTVAGTVSNWYFARDQRSSAVLAQERPLSAFLIASTYSFGSCAFAGLTVGLFESVMSLQRWLERSRNGQNIVMNVLSFCGCLQMAPYINRYAFVHIAMHGSTFLQAARETFRLFGRNEISTLITRSYMHLVPWSGRMIAMGSSFLLLGYSVKDSGERLHIVTVILSAVLSSGIFGCFAALTSYSAEAVMVCYCQDVEHSRNADSNIISKDLNDIIQNHAANSTAPTSHESTRISAHDTDNL